MEYHEILQYVQYYRNRDRQSFIFRTYVSKKLSDLQYVASVLYMLELTYVANEVSGRMLTSMYVLFAHSYIGSQLLLNSLPFEFTFVSS